MPIQNKSGPQQQWTPETPWFGPDKKTEKVWPRWTCRNPSCGSFGKSHPGCNCGESGSREPLSGHQQGLNYASGGQVHFCSTCSPHSPECEHFADGGEVQANQEFQNNPDLSFDHSVVQHGLNHLLTKTGHSKSEDPNRVAEDHLDSVRRGRKALEVHSKNLFETSKEHQIESDPAHVESLKAHLYDLRMDPSKVLDVGGSLGGVLPDHAGMFGAKTATIMNYAEAIRPKSQQLNPMSAPIPPSKMDEAKYQRQLAVAEKPQIIYQAIKGGTLQPDDLHTVQTLYPKLFEQMRNQATESIINSRTDGKEIPYKQRAALSLLIGQPLDYTQSPAAAQAIIMANGGAQSSQQKPQEKKKSGATAQTQKTIAKTDDLYETPIESSLIDKKTRS